MTPRGTFTRATAALARIARGGDRIDLDRYLRQHLQQAIRDMTPDMAVAFVHVIGETRAKIDARLPLAPPSNRTKRWDAERIAELRASVAKHGEVWIRVALDLGIAPGAARLAHRRYIVGGAAPVSLEKTRRHGVSQAMVV